MAPPLENDGAAVIVAAFVGIASVSISLSLSRRCCVFSLSRYPLEDEQEAAV